ncbi:MAG: hypothetical protein ACYDCQ_03580 [Dehalococcoidia bacterium]
MDNNAANPIAGAKTVNVTLTEYMVAIDTTAIPAGSVHLVVKNAGTRGHQLQVYPQAKAPATGANSHMQMANNGRVDGVVGALKLVTPGQTMVLDLDLSASKWEFACHLQDSLNGQAFDYYDKGMKNDVRVGS